MMVYKHALYDFYYFTFVKVFYHPRMWSILVDVHCEKNVHSSLVEWAIL